MQALASGVAALAAVQVAVHLQGCGSSGSGDDAGTSTSTKATPTTVATTTSAPVTTDSKTTPHHLPPANNTNNAWDVLGNGPDFPPFKRPPFGCPTNATKLTSGKAPAGASDTARGFYMYRVVQTSSFEKHAISSNNLGNIMGILGYLMGEVVKAPGATGYQENCPKGSKDCCARHLGITLFTRLWVTVDNHKGMPKTWHPQSGIFGPEKAMDCGCASGLGWKYYRENQGYPVGCGHTGGDNQIDHGPGGVWYSTAGPCPSRVYSTACTQTAGCEMDPHNSHKALVKNQTCETEHPGGVCGNVITDGQNSKCTFSYMEAGTITLDELEGLPDGKSYYDLCMEKKYNTADWKNNLNPDASLYKSLAGLSKCWSPTNDPTGCRGVPPTANDKTLLKKWFADAEKRVQELFDSKYGPNTKTNCLSCADYAGPSTCSALSDASGRLLFPEN